MEKDKKSSVVEDLILRAEKDDKKAKMELSKMLSIRQRLERRLNKRTVKVPFKDDLGDFVIEIRLMSPNEQKRLLGLYSKLNAFLVSEVAEDNKAQVQRLLDEGTALLEQIYNMAGYLCVDPDLNADYWKKGSGFNIDVPLKIIRTAVSESQKLGDQIEKFRLDRTG